MSRLLFCVGTLLGPCPTRSTWRWAGIGPGKPRKRCMACVAQEHRERSFLDRSVKEGATEAEAMTSLFLREARVAIIDGRHAEGMRLTQRAMQGLTALLGPASLGTEDHHSPRVLQAPVRANVLETA